jgi:uncharacterized protein YegL
MDFKKRTSLNDLDLVQNQPRPLPVILLLDVSGSMNDTIEGRTKISVLNECMKTMLKTFIQDDSLIAEIHCQVTTFGGVAKEYISPTSAKNIQWIDLTADGGTPMGEAFNIAKNIVEDKNKISSRSYRPTIILVSDGMPTDLWENKLTELLSGRSGKADRMALFIGNGNGEDVLKRFLGQEHQEKFFTANQVQEIVKFFRFVTMSVTTKTKSADPNIIPAIPTITKLIESNDGWTNN